MKKNIMPFLFKVNNNNYGFYSKQKGEILKGDSLKCDRINNNLPE